MLLTNWAAFVLQVYSILNNGLLKRNFRSPVNNHCGLKFYFLGLQICAGLGQTIQVLLQIKGEKAA